MQTNQWFSSDVIDCSSGISLVHISYWALLLSAVEPILNFLCDFLHLPGKCNDSVGLESVVSPGWGLGGKVRKVGYIEPI